MTRGSGKARPTLRERLRFLEKRISRRWLARWAPEIAKAREELRFWRDRQRSGGFENRQYETMFTSAFGLQRDFFVGKRILDVGCGPMGSLEWASMAAERVGLDPLARRYLELGASTHSMRYVEGGSEAIPFPDGYFDIVSSFNSLDHVRDVGASLHEFWRVLREGGSFLLMVDVNREPTVCEPHRLSWDVLARSPDPWVIEVERRYAASGAGLFEDVARAVATDPACEDRPGILVVRAARPRTGREQNRGSELPVG